MSQNDPAVARLQVQAYDALNSYLQAHNDQVAEIEVLSPAIQPTDGILMQDGLSVGIPKKILALAYVEARKRFFNHAKTEDLYSIALQATKVILLFDPEHLTAANFRKHRLVTLRSTATPDAEIAFRKAVDCEFCFLDSILTSPLHRQSKSPTLWYHRFWLLELLGLRNLKTVPENGRTDFWRTELASVCKSGERHPKNYYAWQYGRRLLDSVHDTESKLEYAQSVKNWCCKHPSDISGWSCLTHLISNVESLSDRLDIVRDVLGYAIALQFQHESLWVFIRTIVAHDMLHEGQVGLVLMLQNYSKELESTGKHGDLLECVVRNINWIKKHGGTFDGSVQESNLGI
jgi:hypothetical protein